MIIAVDFDGTLCVHKFPEIGQGYQGIIEKLIRIKNRGNQLILWTCREGAPLAEAIAWCEERGLKFDAINENVEELKNKDFAHRKIYADVYLDDRNITPESFLLKLEHHDA